MEIMILVAGLLIGVVVGVICTWIFQERCFVPIKRSLQEEVEEHKLKIHNFEIEHAKTQERSIYLENELSSIKDILKQKENSVSELSDKLAREETERTSSEKRIKEQRDEFDKVKEQLKTDFQNLANGILEDKSKRFTEQNKKNIDEVLAPLSEKIKEFKNKVETTHEQQTRDGIKIIEQIKNLTELNVKMSQEANNLTNALKGQSKTMGNWGELILETLLEHSGLQKGEEYLIQESFKKEDGTRSQPDIIINLPEKKHLVIDSKVSLVAYERYCSESENENKDQHLKSHIASIRKHVNDLTGKNYQELYQISTPDFIMMFIPLDPALIIALQNDPKLFMEAFDKGIFLVSPATLLFALRTIANLWKREKQNRNALEIAKRSGQLYDKFVLFYEKLEELGVYIKKTQESYEDSLNKLKTGRGSLVSRIEKIKQLGARTSKALPNDAIEDNDLLLDSGEDE